MRQIVVEFLYQPPLTEVGIRAVFERLQPLLERAGVQRLRWWVAEDRSRGFCELEGADVQTVAEAYQRAEVPYLRIWLAKRSELDLSAGLERYEELADP